MCINNRSLPPISPLSYILDKHGPKGAMVMQKQWSPNMDPFPHQITVVDIAAHAPEFREKAITLEQLFPPKSECFIVSPPHYGSLAEVSEVIVTLRLSNRIFFFAGAG